MRRPLARRALPLLPLLLAPGLAAQGPDPVHRAQRLVDERHYAEAREILEPYAARHPQDARAAFYLGRALHGEEEIDRAVEWLQKAVRLDGTRSSYHYHLGVAYGEKALRASRLRQPFLASRVRTAFERAVALDPDNLEARAGLVQFHLVAPSIMGGDRSVARAQAEEIRRRDAYRGALAMGAVHTRERDLPAAVAEYRTAMRQFPDSAAAYLALVAIHGEREQYEAAFDLLDSLLARQPEHPAAHYQLGRLGAITGQRLERAEEALKRYLAHRPARNEPPLAAAHWRLGMIYEKLGRTDQARAEYRASLALDPRRREAREALRRLGG